MAEFNSKFTDIKINAYAVVCVVCLLIVVGSMYIVGVKRSDNAILSDDIVSQREYIEQELKELSTIHAYEKRFSSVMATGFMEKEDRLPWIERLENLAITLRLARLQYEFSPQRQQENEKLSISSNISLYESSLNIKADLLHEGDLVTLVSELKKLSAGVFVVDNCSLTRITDPVVLSDKHNFTFDCNFLLYTARYQDGLSSEMSMEP